MTPKGTRPSHLRTVDEPADHKTPVDEIIDLGGRDLLEESDPLAAETWASGLLVAFEAARQQAKLHDLDVPPFVDGLVHRCRQRRDRYAAVVATALAAVAPSPHEAKASTVAGELRRCVAGLPEWLGLVGAVTATRGWAASDVFGDQDSLIVSFAQAGSRREHALVVLVDHNLSGQAKDAWISDDADDVVATWRSTADPHMRVREVPVAEALQRLRDAMAASDLWNGDVDLRTEDFAHYRGLIWARLRRAGLGDARLVEPSVTPVAAQALVAEFLASPGGLALTRRLTHLDVEILVSNLVGLRCAYEERPLRWSPTVVSLLLGELAPRKLLLDTDQANAFPDVVRAFVEYSAERAGPEPPFVQETLEAVDAVEADFLRQMGDPSAAGPAKAVLESLQARGVDLSDIDAINAALADDTRLPLPMPKRARPKRRGTPAAPPEVVASAEAAPVLSRLDILTSFYGEGRKLTQTGQPTLADARALVGLLGTRDRIDQVIGDRTFKTKSAAELPELGFTIRWALAAGALRKEHGKLRATTSWAKLGAKPLQRWAKAADAMVSLGPLAAFHADARYGRPDELLDELAPEILTALSDDDRSFDSVLEWICQRADSAYEWLAPYMQNPDTRRRVFDWDLTLLTRVLGWAGVVERLHATLEADRFGEERLVGGTLTLTPLGRWWLTS